MKHINFAPLVFLFLLLKCNYLISQTTLIQNLTGTYICINNKFEKFSSLYLKADSTFIYNYALGGCQDNIYGHWTLSKNNIVLEINRKDTSQHYTPDLNSITWKITSRGLKPNAVIDNGCFKEKGLYKKQLHP